MANAFEYVKSAVAIVTGSLASPFSSVSYLATSPLDWSLFPEQVIHQQFNSLNQQEKEMVYNKIWELAKMKDPRITGLKWGEEHALEDLQRLTKALHRYCLFFVL
jgi:hypothetical protein